MTFDIPVNFKIEATTEEKAEAFLFDFLKMATKEFRTEQKIVDWEYFDFISEESVSN